MAGCPTLMHHWETKMNFSNITDVLNVIIALVGLIAIWHQIVMTRASIEADHLRRKKESTFNGYNLIREDFRKLNNEILSALNIPKDSKLDKSHFDTLRENPQLMEKMQTLLSYIQRIAVGVQNDVYDMDILLDLSGTPFIRAFDRYYPHILESRQSSITFYQEAEYFINKLKKLREERISETRHTQI